MKTDTETKLECLRMATSIAIASGKAGNHTRVEEVLSLAKMLHIWVIGGEVTKSARDM